MPATPKEPRAVVVTTPLQICICPSSTPQKNPPPLPPWEAKPLGKNDTCRMADVTHCVDLSGSRAGGPAAVLLGDGLSHLLSLVNPTCVVTTYRIWCPQNSMTATSRTGSPSLGRDACGVDVPRPPPWAISNAGTRQMGCALREGPKVQPCLGTKGVGAPRGNL